MVEQHSGAEYSLLTEVELASLDRKGLRRQARTIQKLADFAVITGLSSEVTEQIAERIRNASSQEVKAYNNALTTTVELFTGIDRATEQIPDAEDLQAALDTAELDQVVEELVDDGKDSEAHEASFLVDANLAEIRSFYTSINKKSDTVHLVVPDTDEDIDRDEVQALFELYARNSKRPKLVKSMIDKAIMSLEKGSQATAKEFDLTTASVHSLRYTVSTKIAELLDAALGESDEATAQPPENPQELISNVVHGDFEHQPTSIRRVEIENGKARLV